MMQVSFFDQVTHKMNEMFRGILFDVYSSFTGEYKWLDKSTKNMCMLKSK